MSGKGWTDLKLFLTQLFLAASSQVAAPPWRTGLKYRRPNPGCSRSGSSLFRSRKQEDPNPCIVFAQFVLFGLAFSYKSKSSLVPIPCFTQSCSGGDSCILQQRNSDQESSSFVPECRAFPKWQAPASGPRQHLPTLCRDTAPVTQGRCPLCTQIPADLQGTILLPCKQLILILISWSLSKCQGCSPLALLGGLLE